MNDILSTIRSRVGEENLSDSCRKNGCRVSMEGVSRCRVIVDADLAFPAHDVSSGRCDYIVFLADSDSNAFVVPLELKGGGVDASEVVVQLQRGADFADLFVPETDGDIPLLPVLFHSRSIHPNQRKTLNRTKIRFRGRDLTIKTGRCNHPRNLANLLGVQAQR